MRAHTEAIQLILPDAKASDITFWTRGARLLEELEIRCAAVNLCVPVSRRMLERTVERSTLKAWLPRRWLSHAPRKHERPFRSALLAGHQFAWLLFRRSVDWPSISVNSAQGDLIRRARSWHLCAALAGQAGRCIHDQQLQSGGQSPSRPTPSNDSQKMVGALPPMHADLVADLPISVWRLDH